MSLTSMTSIYDHFQHLEDPRIERTKRHKLIDIVTIALCAVICGADGFEQMEEFGKSKEAWLRTFLELPNGIPSHDTFGRVFARLHAKKFQECFLSWVAAAFEQLPGQVIPVDGKTVRRSHDRGRGTRAIHVVSAWASANRLVLGQVKVDAKSNEITAIPELLGMLEIAGCIVTIDAMGCQTAIAAQIKEQEGEYVLALKGNQETLHEVVKEVFEGASEKAFEQIEHGYHETNESGHGRREQRRYWVLDAHEWIENLESWVGIKTIGMVESTREVKGKKETIEQRYYISSLAMDGKQFAEAVRGHWGIENSLHWVLDIAFREDESRIRAGSAQENMVTLRHMAINLLKEEKSKKFGIPTKRLKAGWDEAYLLKIIGV